jgi:ribonuclease P protein component
VKRIYSLKGRNLFREVYQKGRKLQGTGIRVFIFNINKSIYVKPVTTKERTGSPKNIKIAITPARSYGNAYARNRGKRRIRAICSEMLGELKEGFYIIIRIDNDFRDLAFEDEKNIVRSLFAKAGLFIDDASKQDRQNS